MESRWILLIAMLSAACADFEPVDSTAELNGREQMGRGIAEVGEHRLRDHDRFGNRGDADDGGDPGDDGGDDGGASTDDSLRLALPPGSAFLAGDEQLGTDVLSAVSGGVAPFQCAIYRGNGAGTVPLGVGQDWNADPTGCTISGAMFGAPGNYGFFVEVYDATGVKVDVPVMYEGPPCDTAEVTMAPAPADLVIGQPGAAHTFRIDVTDIDSVADGEVCDTCLTTSVLTRAPLETAPRLDCNAPGDVCTDGETVVQNSCPSENAATATRFVAVDAHDPVRGDKPGWMTVDITINYSGAQLAPCGGKRWACHVEVLEVP